MAIKVGATMGWDNEIHQELYCDYCGYSLGSYHREGGIEYYKGMDKSWCYCPCCGELLHEYSVADFVDAL